MLHIGLTGGIGSGKSTVNSLFRKKGAVIIDFDSLAHSVEEPGTKAWREIVEYFGQEVLNQDSTINREALGKIVFQDKAKLKILNNIVHPAVLAAWKDQCEDTCRQNEHAIIISDIPLLIEAGLHKSPDLDLILLVYISREEQIKRIMKRNGFSREEAEARINAQMPIDEKLPFADIVINNEGLIEKTAIKVNEIWHALIRKEKEICP